VTPPQTYGVRIVSPYFVARIEVADGFVVFAAPIVRSLLGLTAHEAAKVTHRRRWQTQVLR